MRKKLEDYITENYNKLLIAAFYITKDDTNSDLLSIVLLSILDRKTFSKVLKNCYNFFNYINRAMILQYTNKYSEYNKLYKSHYCFEDYIFDYFKEDEED